MSDRYAQNLAFLQQHHPILYSTLQPYLHFAATTDASGYNVQQLVQWPYLGGPDRQFLEALERQIAIFSPTDAPQPFPYHLLVLGLGEHLQTLRERTQPRYLILYESQPDRLIASLHRDNWSEWGKDFFLLFDPEQRVSAHDLLQILVGRNLLTADGAMVAVLQNSARETLLGQAICAESLTLAEGWLAIEYRLRSLRNACIQTKQPNVRQWQPHSARPNAPPVMIVGSGPSAEILMEEIRRLAPSCLVVAAGTASHVLLKHGIVPDLAVILGDGRRYYNEHKLATERWEILREVPLFLCQASDPRFARLSNPLILYGYSETPFSCPIPTMTAPTVTNAALSLMAEAGFTDFLFFGIDMGARRQDYRYAQAHPRIDAEALPETGYIPDMSLRVRGNFGGQVWTDSAFSEARRSFESYLARNSHLQIRNCADGALIQGAQPCIAKKLVLPLRADKADFLQDFIAEFQFNDPQSNQKAWAQIPFREDLLSLRQDLEAALSNPYSHVYDLADSLWQILRHRHNLPRRLMQGTLLSMVYGMVARLNRLPPDKQDIALPQAVTLFKQAVFTFCDQILVALNDIDAGRDGDWLALDET